jgi:hypothetical protein
MHLIHILAVEISCLRGGNYFDWFFDGLMHTGLCALDYSYCIPPKMYWIFFNSLGFSSPWGQERRHNPVNP